jgi:pilus assembly protein Flp/PilA
MMTHSSQTGIKVGNFTVLGIAVTPRKIPPARMQVISTRGLIMNFMNFWKDENGATAIEYGLIAALIAVVIITGVTAVGTSLSTTFTNISGNLK